MSKNFCLSSAWIIITIIIIISDVTQIIKFHVYKAVVDDITCQTILEGISIKISKI